ncbi:glycine--tRNA ligase [Candidatus Woesearchaeota archaeon]|nr:glycine--tRNA ligase [Candidatus Woesearchaeota archaeon]
MGITIDDMATFCKKKGFVYPSSEIYGGLAGFWDYGPLGAELKNNLKQAWWKFHVHDREDVVGIDGSIITHPKVWVASGHVGVFADVLVECQKCHERYRADMLLEDVLKIKTEGLKPEDLDKLIKDNKVVCQKCKGSLSDAAPFNLMFQTFVGPKQDKESIAYLRPETAQVIFADFKAIVDTSRVKLPFGVAQMGRAFRNEIAPRNFLFRCREFEQMELEYFIHPNTLNNCPYLPEVMDHRVLVYSAELQKQEKPAELMTMKQALAKNIIKTPWHAYWLATEHKWFTSLGANPDKFRIRQHLQDEKSHYALDTWDLEYEFPFGWKELQGMANRTDYDLKQHMKYSGKDLSIFDEETKQKVVPHVVCEPSQGVDRAFLVFMFDAYEDDAKRGNIVLHLHPKLAPVKAGIFPLLSNREELTTLARSVFKELSKRWQCQYDKSGSIGRRYARADELGMPYCLTIDFDSLKQQDVTVRDRDATTQVRVLIKDLPDVLGKLLAGELEFERAGRRVEGKS